MLTTPTPNRAAKWLVASMGGAALACTTVVTEIVIVGLRDPIEAWQLSYPVLVGAAAASEVLFRRNHQVASEDR